MKQYTGEYELVWLLWKKKKVSCMHESSLRELENMWTAKNQVMLLGFPKSSWEDPSPKVWKEVGIAVGWMTAKRRDMWEVNV